VRRRCAEAGHPQRTSHPAIASLVLEQCRMAPGSAAIQVKYATIDE